MQQTIPVLIAIGMGVVYSSIAGSHAAAYQYRAAFKSGVDVVTLNVTVTDGSKRYVPDLTAGDFMVFENGRKQDVTFFQKEALPLALVLLLDTSSSMAAALPTAQEAAIHLVHELEPDDVASVMSFDSTVRALQAFTNDRALLESAIRKTEPDGMTVLYNAVYIALRHVNTAARYSANSEPRRRALVVLSDGRDTSSLLRFDDVLDLSARSDAAIYSIGLRLPSAEADGPDGARNVLTRLAQQTGGRAFFPEQAGLLIDVYREIKRELSNQYALAYESNNVQKDGRFRQIAVRVSRVGVVARTRPGYFGPLH